MDGGQEDMRAVFVISTRAVGPPGCEIASPRVRHNDSSLLAAFEPLPFSRQLATDLPMLWQLPSPQ